MAPSKVEMATKQQLDDLAAEVDLLEKKDAANMLKKQHWRRKIMHESVGL